MMSKKLLCADAAEAKCEFAEMDVVNGNITTLMKKIPILLVDYRLCPYIRTTLNLFHHFVNVVTIQGEVNFVQNSPSENLKITVANVVGLKDGKHGFHIHKNEN